MRITPPNFDNVPQFLRDIPCWVLWKAQPVAGKPGKVAKVPKSARGGNASSTDPKTWCTFEVAKAAYLRAPVGTHSGVGLVLDGQHGVVGIDLDHCIETVRVEDDVLGDHDVRSHSTLARETMLTVPGYWEVSPSGTGLRGFIRSSVGGDQIVQKQVSDGDGARECYVTGRYLTVTGDKLEDSSSADWAVSVDTRLLNWLDEWMVKPGGTVGAVPTRGPVAVVTGDGSAEDFAADGQIKGPAEGWDLERVRSEILPHIAVDCEYEQWLEVGAALHHQFGGSEEGFALWREAFASGGKQAGEEYDRPKWESFGGSARPVTLRTLLKKTSEARRAVEVAAELAKVADWTAEIIAATSQAGVEEVCRRIAGDVSVSDITRDMLAKRVQQALGILNGSRPSIQAARKLVKLTPVAIAAARNQAPLPDVSPTGILQATEMNLETLCLNEGIVVRYNVISKEQEILIPGRGFTKDNRANAALAALQSICAKANLNIDRQIRGLLTTMADSNQYNPVLTWMESKDWDGVDRIEDLCDTIKSPMDRKLKRKMLEYWLVQGAAAADQGGLQVRGVLVFQGGQYKGKTRWLESLAPARLNAISTGKTLDPRDRDSVKQALSFWLVELGELDATFKKSDIAHLKGFLSRHEDVFRLPYAAAESKFDRRTVFFGTVNDPDFLNDPSGNTRFWTIPITDINHTHTIDVQQLWGQVLAMVHAGALHYPTPEDMAAFDQNNAGFVAEDPVADTIARKYAWGIEDVKWVELTATQVLRACELDCRGVGDTRRAGAALRRLNGNRNRVKDGTVLHMVPITRDEAL